MLRAFLPTQGNPLPVDDVTALVVKVTSKKHYKISDVRFASKEELKKIEDENEYMNTDDTNNAQVINDKYCRI